MFPLFFNTKTFLFIFIPCVILVFVLFLILFLLKKKKNKKKQEIIDNYYQTIIACVGGIDNIVQISSTGSRLSFVLKDFNKLDENKLKEIQITGIFKTSTKITLIVGSLANQYCTYIQKELEK